MIRTRAGYVLSRHALEQMLDRGVSPGDVDRALGGAEQTYPCRHGNRMVHQRGDLAVVVAPDALTVVTVLYRLPRGWTAEHGRPSGRRMSKLTRRRLEADLRRAGSRS